MKKQDYQQVTLQAHAWYMEERSRTLKDTAREYNVCTRTLLDRFKALSLDRKSNHTHHYEDLKGQRFGRCIAVEKMPRTRIGGIRWKCVCDCGNNFEAYAQNLKAGNTTGCGCGREGSNHKFWNSTGKSIVNGYVLVRHPSHPRANRNGFVREHIVVMEKVLGRFITESEEIHHKNGIRHDDSEGNLELWNRSHPVGARVEDLVEYSMKILSMYRPELLRNTTQ